MDQIYILGKNFTNSEELSEDLVASVHLNGRVFESARLEAAMELNPSARYPTFDLDLKMAPVAVTNLNDFARAYAKFDFERGTLAVAAELAASEGRLQGYVKPLFDNVAILDVREDAQNPLKMVWEGLVGGVTRLFRNQPRERFATKIPLQGSFKDPQVLVLPTVGNIFKNAFVEAYQGNIENIIELESSPSSREAR